VRIEAHAFGTGRPASNLLLSPDHAVSVVGVLIAARYPINGASVTQELMVYVTYWRLGLARHAVRLAEGLAWVVPQAVA